MRIEWNEAVVRGGGKGECLLGPTTMRLSAGLTALTGLNGSGKSTWIRSAAALVPLHSGNIRWIDEGRVLTTASMRQLLGYVPQDLAVHDDMTPGGYLQYIGELKCLGGYQLDTEIRRVTRLLELQELPGTRRRIRELSEGEQRRLMIAQSLLGNPRLLLMDEPFANIDPAMRGKLLLWLQEYAAATCAAVLISTHDVEEIRPGDYGTVLVVGEGGCVSRFP